MPGSETAARALSGACVLITGGTGFLGAHLTRRLVRSGVRPHVAVRQDRPRHRIADVESSVRLVHMDVLDRASVDACIEEVRPDVVFHLAGVTAGRRAGRPDEDARHAANVNLEGTRRLFEAVARTTPAARVIRTGGLAEYGAAPVPSREDQPEQPVSAYGVSQLEATRLGQALYRQSGLAVTTLRLALAYGPGQSRDFFVPSLIEACLNGRPFEMRSHSHTRDFLYVDDAVDALVGAAGVPNLAGEVLNVGSGREYKVGDVAALIVRLAGGQAELRRSGEPPVPADVARQVCDPSRAKIALGWVAQTAIEDGLARTIAWYRGDRAS